MDTPTKVAQDAAPTSEVTEAPAKGMSFPMKIAIAVAITGVGLAIADKVAQAVRPHLPETAQEAAHKIFPSHVKAEEKK